MQKSKTVLFRSATRSRTLRPCRSKKNNEKIVSNWVDFNLSRINDLHRCMRAELTTWFRLVLQWDPKRRGKIKDNEGSEQVVVFSILKSLLSRKVHFENEKIWIKKKEYFDESLIYGMINFLFDIRSYRCSLLLCIDWTRTSSVLKQASRNYSLWFSKKQESKSASKSSVIRNATFSRIPIHSSSTAWRFVFIYFLPIRRSFRSIFLFLRYDENILQGSHLIVLHIDGPQVNEAPRPLIPSAVRRILENRKVEDPETIDRYYSAAVFFIRQELELFRTYVIALSINM